MKKKFQTANRDPDFLPDSTRLNSRSMPSGYKIASWRKLHLRGHRSGGQRSAMITANLKFPHIGEHRELKFAFERFWAAEWNEEPLQQTGRV
jgi:hypothetical protein